MSEVKVRSKTMGRLEGRLGWGSSRHRSGSPPARREWQGGREGFEWRGGSREGLLEGGRRPGQEREWKKGVREPGGRSKTNKREGPGGRAGSTLGERPRQVQ